MRYDVAVIGGGPSGAAAGLLLAQKGVRVGIFEKQRLPRYKPCGGGVTARVMEILPRPAAEVVERRCDAVSLHLGPEGLGFTVRKPDAVLGMVMRDRFDAALLSAAEESGATVHSPCRVNGLCREGTGLRLDTSAGAVACRFAVAADGALSRVAGMAGWRETRRLALAVELELEASSQAFLAAKDVARFDFAGIRGGYGWVFPKREHLSVGVGALRRNGPAGLASMLRDYLAGRGLTGARTIRRQGGVIPVSPRRDGFVRNRVLLVGDAAGLADPLTGEGIYGALTSGFLAAEALQKGRFQEQYVKEAYEHALQRRLLGELSLGRGLAGFFYGWSGVRNLLFGLYGQQLSEAMTMVVIGQKSYKDLLGDPGNYLRLLKSRKRSRSFEIR